MGRAAGRLACGDVSYWTREDAREIKLAGNFGRHGDDRSRANPGGPKVAGQKYRFFNSDVGEPVSAGNGLADHLQCRQHVFQDQRTGGIEYVWLRGREYVGR